MARADLSGRRSFGEVHPGVARVVVGKVRALHRREREALLCVLPPPGGVTNDATIATMPTGSTLHFLASIASFVAAAATFAAGNTGLGAAFVAQGALFVALAERARAAEKRPK